MTSVLVIGGGAREHVIGWKLRQSPVLSDLFFAPGNGGTSSIGTNLSIRATDAESIVRAATEHRIDLVFVGPEEPLTLGLVDELQRAGITCFGPTRAAARVEASKQYAKELMDRVGISTANWASFDDASEARRHIEAQSMPIVIKANGLAAGKGVAVCRTVEEATAFVDDAMIQRAFGDAGARIIVEECLVGAEVSAFALCDGEQAVLTAPACDYKAIADGDIGPNTGGMGSYSPSEFVSDTDLKTVHDRVFNPILREMAADGTPFRGILYAGLMVTADGLRVLEFNCRMGDPEAQVVLPRLRGDLLSAVMATSRGSVKSLRLEWDRRPRVGVVIASGGYPGTYATGFPISGLEEVDSDVLVFHSGTATDGPGRLVTSGGRVLTIVGTGATMGEARDVAYQSAERIKFEGAHYRRDIALRAVEPRTHQV